MNKIVCTLNVGHNCIHDNARSSLREAARRWGANFVEILVPSGDTSQHHYYQKLRLPDHLPDDCRVVYYDGDVIVRSDCPSPFEVVPEGDLGWVRAHYPSHGGSTWNVIGPLRDFCAEFGAAVNPKEEYPNTGMMLLEFPRHRELFAEAIRMVERRGFDSRWQIADQGFLAVARQRLELPVFWIPPMFQFTGDRLWAGWTPTMHTLGYHFCGPICRDVAVPRTVWDDLGPDRRIADTEHKRWEQGKPRGLNSGAEVPYFIRELSRVRHGKVVEIGCYLGGMTWYGAQIARDNWSEYFAVDHWQGAIDLHVDDVIFRGFMQNMRDAELDEFVQVIKKPSTIAAADFADGSLDLVFVDADHTHAGCLADIRAWWPKLSRGGVMLGHDYTDAHGFGVKSAVAEAFGQPHEVSAGAYPIWKVSKAVGSGPGDLPTVR